MDEGPELGIAVALRPADMMNETRCALVVESSKSLSLAEIVARRVGEVIVATSLAGAAGHLTPPRPVDVAVVDADADPHGDLPALLERGVLY